MRRWSLVMVSGVLLWSSTAQAGVEFETVQTTESILPNGANPGARIAVSDEGKVVLTTSSNNAALILPLTLGTGPDTTIEYTYEDNLVTVDGFTFGPGGDILLRGTAVPELDPPFGLTARIALDGNIVWEQPDAAFNDDDTFIGRYVGTAGPIAYSATAQRLLIFTEASFDVAPVSQGTMLFEFNGDVRAPSVLFGDEYIGATLNNALTTPDGKFLVYYFSQNDRGTRFFIYDGIQNVSFFEPEGGDWASRVVYQVDYDPNQNLILLWSDLADEGDASVAKLTKLDPDGKLLWETDLGGTIGVEVEDPDTGLGMNVQAQLARPFFMVSAAEEIVFIRQAGPNFVFDVRSSTDGAPLGFFNFFEITENSVFDLTFLNGSDREYLLSTVNLDTPSTNSLLQVKLILNDDPVNIGDGMDPDVPANNSPGNNNPNNDGPIVDPDDEPVDPPNIPEIGCGCDIPGGAPQTPVWPLVGLALLALTARFRP